MAIGEKEKALRALRDRQLQPRVLSSVPKRKRAAAGTFDRTAYQRDLMRKRRAAKKAEA